MDHPLPPTSPLTWVHKRDGRLVPFDPDKICSSIFAAGETLGLSDPFRARELADSVLHFLANDAAGSVTGTAQIAELVVKVTRELGQPALSRAYQEGQGKPKRVPTDEKAITDAPPGASVGPSVQQMEQWLSQSSQPTEFNSTVAGTCLREFSLAKVYSRELVTAHYQGLITLHGLEMPLELPGYVLSSSVPDELAEAIHRVRQFVGGYVAIVGPEHYATEKRSAEAFAQCLGQSLEPTGLEAVVNLNRLKPPASAEWLGDGPLFAAHRPQESRDQLDAAADALCENITARSRPESPIRIDWHLAGRDFEADNRSRLGRIARRVLEGAPIALVMDRSPKSDFLAEGLEEKSPALLQVVSLNLARLIGQLGTDIKPDAFLQKLKTMVRLALSAGVQKREFLRAHAQGRPELTGGFLLERARLQVVPNGLPSVTDVFFRERVLPFGQAAQFTHRALDHLVRGLRDEGRMRLLETCVEVLPEALGELDSSASALPPTWGIGTVSWQLAEPITEAVETAGKLHALCGGGTLHISFSENEQPALEDMIDLLDFAWKKTGVVRLRFHRATLPSTQLAAPWAQGASV